MKNMLNYLYVSVGLIIPLMSMENNKSNLSKNISNNEKKSKEALRKTELVIISDYYGDGRKLSEAEMENLQAIEKNIITGWKDVKLKEYNINVPISDFENPKASDSFDPIYRSTDLNLDLDESSDKE